MRPLRVWFEKILNSLGPLLSRCLSLLPERVSVRLSRVRCIRRAAIANLAEKWKDDHAGFIPTHRAKAVAISVGDSRPPALAQAAAQASNPDYAVLHGRGRSMANRRIALMAHHDPHNVVDPYVAHYLRHLRAIGYEPVLATCGDPALTPELEGVLLAAVARLGPGYDFTSWRAAFAAFPELMEAGELLLCNDSVFAPIGSFLPIHQKMESVDCDFWGLCESRERRQHLQSYYIVFKRTALNSPAFRSFWASMKVENVKDAIAAELGLTQALAAGGLIAGAYVPSECLPLGTVNPMHLFWRPLIERFDVPCLKRNLLRAGLGWFDTRAWRHVLANKGYDLSLIDNYHARIRGRHNEGVVLQ